MGIYDSCARIAVRLGWHACAYRRDPHDCVVEAVERARVSRGAERGVVQREDQRTNERCDPQRLSSFVIERRPRGELSLGAYFSLKVSCSF